MKYLIKVVFLILLLPAISFSQKKMASSGNLYVPAGGFISIFGEYEFAADGGNGKMMTSREDKRGYVNFAQGSNWMGEIGNQFVDGYVMVRHDNAFTFPVGHTNIYAPISISGADKTSAAYFHDSASEINGLKNNVDKGVTDLIPVGYWDLTGTTAVNVTIPFSSIHKTSQISQSDISRLVIVGLQNDVWKIIPSSYDEVALNTSYSNQTFKGSSSLQEGSITTDESIIPSEYDYFTIASMENALFVGDVELSVFPNPSIAGREIVIDYELPSSNVAELRIYNSNNELVASRPVSNQSGKLKLNDLQLNEGTYIMTLTDDQDNLANKKLIIVNN